MDTVALELCTLEEYANLLEELSDVEYLECVYEAELGAAYHEPDEEQYAATMENAARIWRELEATRAAA